MNKNIIITLPLVMSFTAIIVAIISTFYQGIELPSIALVLSIIALIILKFRQGKKKHKKKEDPENENV